MSKSQVQVLTLLLLLIAFGCCPVFGQIVQQGQAAYRLDLPKREDGQPWRQVNVKPLVSPDFTGPVPTCDWSSSLVWPVHSPYSQAMFPHPLALKAEADGLGIGYNPIPKIISAVKDGVVFQPGSEYRFPYRQHLRIGLSDWQVKQTVLDHHSDWAVRALWTDESSELRATFAHGSPFVFFTKNSSKPVHVQFTAPKTNRVQEPVRPLVFEIDDVTGSHSGKVGSFHLAVDAGKNIGVGSRARLVYDFDGDGKTDKIESFKLFATDPAPDRYESYDTKKYSLDEATSWGEHADFKSGKVRLEFWRCFGEGDLSLDLKECHVGLPLDDSAYYLAKNGGLVRQPQKGQVKLAGDSKAQGVAKVFYRDRNVVGVTVHDTAYGLFSPSGSEWQLPADSGSVDELVSDLGGRDYFSIAALPNASPEAIVRFAESAFAFITDTRVTYSYDPARGKSRTTFRVTTENLEGDDTAKPIVALYRHQHLHLKDPGQLWGDYVYASPRGEMRLVRASEFSTELPFLGVLPSLPTSTSARELVRGSLRDTCQEWFARRRIFTREDTYWNGKEFGKTVELIQIAHQLGETALRDKLLDVMKQRLANWFDGKGKHFFFYDRVWGTLIGYPDSYGSADQFNDHHFHYSYFIRAAAVISQFDPDWVRDDRYGKMIDTLIRDCANYDRKDTRFAWMRNFDPYAGHSWASGHAGFASGNNQESSSESINFATSLILYGVATENREIRDLGIFWHSTEAEAIKQYWFDADREVFPDGFQQACVGMVWGDGATYGTWWTANPEEIHGINFLPLNGGSLHLGRSPDYVQRNIQSLRAANQRFHKLGKFPGDGREFDRWHDILLEYVALANPETALKQYREFQERQAEFGETPTHTLQWLHSLQALGQFDESVTANMPTAVVFQKEKSRSYVIYNPRQQPQEVKFSDGFSCQSPPGLHVHFKD